MSELVPAEDIESIVGVTRHRQAHYARAVSAEEHVYVLHSQRCLDSGIDLRACRFSVALDKGIEIDSWSGHEDVAVAVGVWEGRLIPLPSTAVSGG